MHFYHILLHKFYIFISQLNLLGEVMGTIVDETAVQPTYPGTRLAKSRQQSVQQQDEPQPGGSGEPAPKRWREEEDEDEDDRDDKDENNTVGEKLDR
jgi:hypothetical protein